MARRPAPANCPEQRGTAAPPATLEDIKELPATIQEILDRMPGEPGVYLMKDKKGRIIYVGKAQSLRQRVRSYFTRSGDNRPFVALLERLIGDIETVVTGNEKEALLLENNLIKQHRPRFNVKLVDDKNFLVLRLDEKAPYPRLEVMRRIRDDGARYFGPYHSATSCRQALEVVNRHFKLRTCTDQVLKSRKRPCLQYQIKRCDAPCVFPVKKEEYAEQVRDVVLFLSGKDRELCERLRARMMHASEQMEFEAACALRDQLRALEKTLEEQRVVSAHFVDQDVFGRYREGDHLEIAILHVRQGKLLGRRAYHFGGQEFPDEESISAFVGLYYDMGNLIPDEVLLPVGIEDQRAKEEWLRERAMSAEGAPRRRRVDVLAPRRGPRYKLVQLANKNAEVAYKTRRDKKRHTEDALGKLMARLHLKRLPQRIECFDISHIQGSDTVASMVVFVDGEPVKSEYRTFKVKSARNDDFAAMYEVLSRRFRRAREQRAREEGRQIEEARAAARSTEESIEVQEPNASEKVGWALPDLLVVDGGKGQLGSALAALKDVGLDLGELDIVALAKERDEDGGERQPDRVFLPKVKDPIRLRPNTAELFILSRIRDEAHRFAVIFHKKLRSRRTIRSTLSDIPTIGPRRQRELLRAFGSVKRIREASLDELSAVPGMNPAAAQAVFEFLRGRPGQGPAQEGEAEAMEENGTDTAEDAAARELSEISETEEAEEPPIDIDAEISLVIAEASARTHHQDG